jgi:SAM-dependent methyltransferase
MQCSCCGSFQTAEVPVLWRELIDEWRLASDEVAYVDRQQGLHCADCGSNLRSMTLAKAIMACFAYRGLFKDFAHAEAVSDVRILEINEAGALTQFLKVMPNYVLARYPDVDMESLPYEDGIFDLVVHSDTLEHVPHPVRGLSECRRILKPYGFCAFTVPMIVDRFTISREGMPPSYHGSPSNPVDCLVHTEYGADAWKHFLLAGFQECRIFALEYPTSQAMVEVR